VAAVPGTNRYLGTQYRPTSNNNNNNLISLLGNGSVKSVTAATNTQVRIKLSDTSSFMRPVSYQRKVVDLFFLELLVLILQNS
jgi:hypothetical protein